MTWQHGQGFKRKEESSVLSVHLLLQLTTCLGQALGSIAVTKTLGVPALEAFSLITEKGIQLLHKLASM